MERRIFMKYVCLGYLEPGKFENMSESERHTVLDCRFEANALIEQGFEPASNGLVLGNGQVARRHRSG
jgi:hypothetical protein